MNTEQFLLILKARKWIGFLALLTVIASTAVVSFLLPKQYSADASLAIDIKAVDPVSGMPVQGYLAPGFMATQVDIISSQNTALKVVDALALANESSAREQWIDAGGGHGDIRHWLAEQMLKNLEVRPSRESSVVSLEYTSPDPVFSATVANAFADAYVRTLSEIRTIAATQSNLFFERQLKELQNKLEVAQQKLSAYQKEHGIVASDERLDVETQRLNELSSQLVGAQGAVADAQSRMRGGSAAPDVLNNPLIQQLKNQLVTQEAKFNELAERNGPNHPHYLQSKAELDATRQQLVQLMGQYAAGLNSAAGNAASRQGALEATLQQQKVRVLELKAQRAKLDVLQRDADSAQRSYDQALLRYSQTALESRADQTNVSVLKSAVAPIRPSSPHFVLNILLAIFVGSLLGVGFSLLAELMDRRVRAASDLEIALGIPVLAVLREGQKRKGWLFNRRGKVAEGRG